ncbi:unnamed protein product [Urochloa humidicola]
MLRDHLKDAHEWLLDKVRYGRAHHIRSRCLRLLNVEDNGRVFLISAGANGGGARRDFAVGCLRAARRQNPTPSLDHAKDCSTHISFASPRLLSTKPEPPWWPEQSGISNLVAARPCCRQRSTSTPPLWSFSARTKHVVSFSMIWRNSAPSPPSLLATVVAAPPATSTTARHSSSSAKLLCPP